MALYTIADTHLSGAVPKSMDVFGKRWIDYVDKLKRGWEAVVTPEDTVILPGDLSWGLNLSETEVDLRFIDALPGKKIIGKGNHDLWWQFEKKLKDFFEAQGITTISLLHNNAHLVEDTIICGSRGWFYDPKQSPEGADPVKISAREVIRTELSLKAGLALDEGKGREILLFFHFPPVYRDFVSRDLIDLMKQYGIKRCFYGHLHNAYDIPSHFCFEDIDMTIVSADYLHFVPLRIR